MVDRLPQPANNDKTKAQQRRRLIWRGAGAGLLVLGLLAVLLACVLWIPKWLYPDLTDNDLRDVKTTRNRPDAGKVQELKDARLKLQNDGRTTLLQGLGALLVLAGATGGVWATLRQVRASHDQLKLNEQGQVTDRYTTAVDQLGHEKAPVRLGALYSLAHLAQDNPEYRQTVVDVFCAYLRMPYAPPARNDSGATQVEQATTPAKDGIPLAHPVLGQNPAQEELQVRKTAQHLLADHLRRPPQTSGQEAQFLPPSPQQGFWPAISLDLTGAVLVDFYFAEVSVIEARFVETTFQGSARFNEATFQGTARFDKATFQGSARFDEVAFRGTARFQDATFFRARFAKATFQDYAWFTKATFQRTTGFNEATFQDHAGFISATFQGYTEFTKATFQGTARFDSATFKGTARFDEAMVEGQAYRVWPDGWTVRPDPTDPSRSTLVPAERAREPEPAVPRPTRLMVDRGPVEKTGGG
jgi:uncharacterized protein YjbI with pentapeptide repeats